MQTLSSLAWDGNANYQAREKEVNMLEELDEYVVACDKVSRSPGHTRMGDTGIWRDTVKGTPKRVYISLHVRIAENQNVGELLYGRNVAYYEELTRLLTEYPLQTSRDFNRRIRSRHQFLVAVAECTESLDYGPK